MENITQQLLKGWKEHDEAQLKEFIDEHMGEEIKIGFRTYKIIGTFMDSNDVPNVALSLLNERDREWKSCHLSLIWEGYKYYFRD